jgi:AraC-like DNA-binding protein
VLAKRIRRQAIVRPAGLLGAAAEGFANLLGPAHEWRVFETLVEALAWSGVSDAGDEARALDALVDVATCGSPVVARIRSWAAAHGGRVTVAEAAQALGMSVRSLQRSLGDAGTSFRDEVNAVLIERAKALLLEGDTKLEVIAIKLGCSSLTTFSAFFRRMTGESPSEFRAARGR